MINVVTERSVVSCQVSNFLAISWREQMTNGQSRKNWQHMVHKTKGQSKMDNLEKLATYGAQNEEKQNKNTIHLSLPLRFSLTFI
jgi:hypothetical protein